MIQIIYVTIFKIDNRIVGEGYLPLVIPEIGINHNGDIKKAEKMISDAHQSGAECVKFQCHIIDDEMIENDVIPPNAQESIWKMMKRCSFSKSQESKLKKLTEKLGMIYLNTPFSRSAVDRLEDLGICCYKIGSGECTNLPLIKYITSKNKPIILSTGMSTFQQIRESVKIIKKSGNPLAIMHVTSQYPTPYENVQLETLNILKKKFPNNIIGLSDHSLKNYVAYGAIGLGAKIIEKHFTSSKKWKGSDIPISITPNELHELIIGTKAISLSMTKKVKILKEELEVAKFAYASVVSIKEIKKGEKINSSNIWVKRPGTGKILAKNFSKILNKKAKKNIPKDTQLGWDMIE